MKNTLPSLISVARTSAADSYDVVAYNFYDHTKHSKAGMIYQYILLHFIYKFFDNLINNNFTQTMS